MADGKIVIAVDADAKKAQKELDSLSAKIDKMEAKLNEDTGTQSGLKKELDAALQAAKQTEDALKSLRSEADRLKDITSGSASANPAEYIDAYSRQAEVAAQIKEQEQLLAQQNKTAESLGNQYAKITDKVINQTAALDAAKTKAGELVQQITNASGASAKMAEASARVEKSMDKFGRRLGNLFNRALVFTVISRGLSQLRSWIGKTIMKSDEARAAVAKLKGALLTLAQPIMKVVIPAFVLLVNVLTRIVNALATLVSKLFGTSFSKSASEAAAAYGEEAEAISGVGDAAEKAGKSMASFDEINQLSGDSGTGGSAGAGGGIGADTIAPDFSAMVKDQLTSITELFAGAALLALGAILTFSGANIPLGIALMALGALAVWDVVSNHWGEIAEILQGQVGLVTAIVSTALLAIGAILVFSGANIPLGLGLMIAGAIGLAATVAANWGAITEALQGPIGAITAIVSGALFVVGAILAFSGANIPLGIGLMVAGAAGLAAVAAVNWNTITETLRGPIGGIVAIVGAALLALGAILAFSGANLPLGIGLMVAGAAGLAAVAAVNWNTITETLRGPIGGIVAIVGAALLALGAILAFSGANLPLGIGLMVAGAAGLAATSAINWDTIKAKLQGPIGKITAIVSAALLAIGAILAFTGANIPLGVGLMAAGAIGLAATVAVNWNTIQGKMQGPLGKITAIVGGALLALGAVLLFTGAGIPLGLGLLAAGGVSLAAAIAPNWNFITEKLKDCWGKIKDFWKKNIAPVFTGEWWANLAKNAMNGLIAQIENGINSALGGLGGLVNGAIRLLNKVPGVDLGTVSWGNVQLPRLASGAVIPPNREFMAVLGDQKSGTNIETPLSTMVQAFKQAMNENGGVGARQMTVVLQLDRRELGRAVYQLNNEESQRVGVRLAGVKA